MVAVLECDDGNEYDALTGAEVDWERPANLGDGLRSASWRLFLRSARDPQRPQRIHWLADWLVREWERRSPEKRVALAGLYLHVLQTEVTALTVRPKRPAAPSVVTTETPEAAAAMASTNWAERFG